MAVTLAPPLTIDLSRQALPDALLPIDLETIKSERLDKLVELAAAAGLPWNSAKRESDPWVRLQESDAYREMFDKIAVNKTIRALLPAFARGNNLDAIVARANVEREVITPADPSTGAPAVMESDANVLRRYLATFSAPSAGSEDAYIALIAKAYPAVQDVRPLGYEFNRKAGRIDIVVLAPGGVDPTPEVMTTCRLATRSTRSVPMTDEIVVRPATIIHYRMAAHLILPRGPDPSLIVNDVRATLQALADQRYYVGGVLPVNALGLIYVPNVVRASALAPAVDVGGPLDAAPYCDGIDLTYEVLK